MDLALKYRPKNLSELRGQYAAKKSLDAVIDGKSKDQCFLFFGDSGTGKTSCARMLAEYLDVDSIEIDASSNPNVDDVREILDDSRFKGAYGRGKLYIIDEANHYSKKSWDTFLKILEEPPEDVYFIFITTEVQKIPSSVKSRLMPIAFTPVTSKEVYEMLDYIAKEEKIKLKGVELEKLVEVADGNLRTAIKALQQFSTTGIISTNPYKDLANKLVVFDLDRNYLESLADLEAVVVLATSELVDRQGTTELAIASNLLSIIYEAKGLKFKSEYIIDSLLLLCYNTRELSENVIS